MSGADPYRELFERSADAILIIEGDRFVACNQAAVDMLRCASREEVLRTHPSELSPVRQPDGRDSFEKANEMIATAFERGSHRFEWDHVRADGEVFPVEVLLTAVQRGEERILHTVWRDITERKQLETQLHHAQKMDAIGRLAGGIAHDFNNLLVAILGYSELLEQRLTETADLDAVRQILRAGERAAALVRQLLAFSRRERLEPRAVDLNVAIADLNRMLRRIIGEDIHLVTSPNAYPVPIHIDPGQLEHAVVNLTTNARDAMPRGGTLTMEIRATGTHAMLRVTDTGTGMEADTARRAFEPFFTTKPLGAGTGLGLASVLSIAQSGEGRVDIDTEPGRGTAVTLTLPLTEISLDEEPTTPERRIRGGTERILVIEDEPAVAQLITRVLSARGYAVVEAHTGTEGAERYLEGDFDLLLTDVVLPDVGGPELVGQLREAGHAPRVLYVSGHTNAAFSEGAALVDLLRKPFSGPELLGRVRDALDWM